MSCLVCHTPGTILTSNPCPTSGLALQFRLYDALGTDPGCPGPVCPECALLLHRLDAVLYEAAELKTALKLRAEEENTTTAEDPFEAEEEEEEEHLEDGIEQEPDPSNLDLSVTVTKTTRGHEQLVYNGYTYLKINNNSMMQQDLSERRWKCTHNYTSKTHCKATLKTTLDGLAVLKDSVSCEHNHLPPEERHLQVLLFRERVKQIAGNHPEMKPGEILAMARIVLDSPSTAALGLKDESVMRYIQRVRSKNNGKRRKVVEEEPQLEEEEEEPTADLVKEIEDLNNATSHHHHHGLGMI